MKYSGVSEEGHKIANDVAIGWLGNTRIQDPFWEQLLHNVAEFYTMEANIHGYRHIFYDDDPAELCKKAKDAGCSKVLMLKIGLFPSNLFDEFTKWYENIYNGEVFTGHVLDKGNLYYEIHPQVMFVDVNWFCDNLSEFAQRFRGRECEFIKPLRSEDNFHDEYTPKWVKQGNELHTYEGTCWGWNVVEEGLKSETGIGIWPEMIRRTYFYSYPEVEDDYINKKADIFDKMHGKETFYIGNTEDFTLPKTLHKGDDNTHKMLVCTAGGLSAVFTGFKQFGQSNNCSIRLMDRSTMALGVSKHIFDNWDPNEETYKDFILDYFNAYPWTKGLALGIHKMDAISEYMEYHEELRAYFNNQFAETPKYYWKIDVFDSRAFIRGLERLINDHMENNPGVPLEMYIHLSNVFHYFQSSFYFSYNERWKQAKYIERKLTWLKNQNKDMLELLLIGPNGVDRYNGYVPFSVDGVDILRIFPWYKNTLEQEHWLKTTGRYTTKDENK